jgi:hypothetical protein
MVEATRRLRPDRVDADKVFTEEDLNVALKQEGYPDYWIKRLAELRHHKPTRRDVRALYLNHVIDEEEVKRQWIDQGFTSDFADMQTQQLKQDRQVADYHRAGYPGVAALVRGYATGSLTQSEFSDLAGRLATYDGQVEQMEEAAQTARNMDAKRAAIVGVKRRFTAGLIGTADAQAELVGAGIDLDQIESLMQWWDQIKRSRPKQVGAATLCTWRKDNLITAGEQMGSLIRLGYTGADANLIVADCTVQIDRARQRAEEKAQQQATKAAAAAAKADAKNQKAKSRQNRRTATP